MLSILLSFLLGETTQTKAEEWAKVGEPRLARGLPQTVPFKFYTRLVYSFGMPPEEDAGSEEEEGEVNPTWWDMKKGDEKLGAPRRPGSVDLAKAPRAAWGMMWWGKKLQQFDWREHAEEFLNLTLDAPKVGDYHASTCTIDPLVWGKDGSLESDAEMAYWYLRWLDKWPNDERRPELMARIVELIQQCDKVQAEHDKVRPIVVSGNLDTSLPTWGVRFLAEASTRSYMDEATRERCKDIVRRSNKGQEPLVRVLEDSATPGKGLATQLALVRAGLRDSKSIEPTGVTKLQLTADDKGTSFDDFGTFRFPVDDTPVTLLRAGALLNRKELMERGVAALRARLNQLSDPTLVANGILVPKTIPTGALAPLTWEGQIHPVADKFECQEGQLMANFAEVADEFGGYFVHASGWAVGIDGVRATPQGPVSVLSSNPMPYTGDHEVEIVRQGKPRKTVEAIVLPSISRIVLEGRKLIAIPGVMKNRSKPALSGTFTMQGSSWSRKARIGVKGFECDWPRNTKAGRFTFKGKINGTPVSFGPVLISGV